MTKVMLQAKVTESVKIKYPCMHSPEEIKAGAKNAIKAYREGKGISHEEMKKRHLV